MCDADDGSLFRPRGLYRCYRVGDPSASKHFEKLVSVLMSQEGGEFRREVARFANEMTPKKATQPSGGSNDERPLGNALKAFEYFEQWIATEAVIKPSETKAM